MFGWIVGGTPSGQLGGKTSKEYVKPCPLFKHQTVILIAVPTSLSEASDPRKLFPNKTTFLRCVIPTRIFKKYEIISMKCKEKNVVKEMSK